MVGRPPPVYLRGIEMQITTIRLPKEWILLAKAQNVNISEICRIALAAALEIEFTDDTEYNYNLKVNAEKKIREKYTALKKEMDEIVQSQTEKQMKQIQSEFEKKKKEEDINKILNDFFKGNMGKYTKRLPEFDRFGDYTSWWTETTEKASYLLGYDISVGEIQNFIRKWL